MKWYNDDTGAHPARFEAKFHWCGRTARAMDRKRCLKAELEGNEEWSCKRVRSRCVDGGWTASQIEQAQRDSTQRQSDIQMNKLQGQTLQQFQQDNTKQAALDTTPKSNTTLLIAGIGGVLVVCAIAYLALSKPSSSSQPAIAQ